MPGRLRLVGEEGPELVIFDRPGTIVPAAETAAILGAGTTQNIVINEVSDPRTTAEAVAQRIGEAAVR
jgi:hypothetical protein